MERSPNDALGRLRSRWDRYRRLDRLRHLVPKALLDRIKRDKRLPKAAREADSFGLIARLVGLIASL